MHETEFTHDETLMLRAGHGDTEAFAEIVQRYQSTVHGTIAKMLGTVEGAEDIAQEVFLRAWKSAPSYRPTAKLSTWLLTITRNLVFNECRRRRRSRLIAFEETTPGANNALEATDHTTPSADSAALQNELHTAIENALANLSEPARMAVILRRYEEMPYEDIARILRLSLPAVKSLLFRARCQLREQLAPWLAKS